MQVKLIVQYQQKTSSLARENKSLVELNSTFTSMPIFVDEVFYTTSSLNELWFFHRGILSHSMLLHA